MKNQSSNHFIFLVLLNLTFVVGFVWLGWWGEKFLRVYLEIKNSPLIPRGIEITYIILIIIHFLTAVSGIIASVVSIAKRKWKIMIVNITLFVGCLAANFVVPELVSRIWSYLYLQ